jgi:hypothetical protein
VRGNAIGIANANPIKLNRTILVKSNLRATRSAMVQAILLRNRKAETFSGLRRMKIVSFILK